MQKEVGYFFFGSWDSAATLTRASEQATTEEPPHATPVPKKTEEQKKICPYWPHVAMMIFPVAIYGRKYFVYLEQIYTGTCRYMWSGRSIPAALVGNPGKSLKVSS